MMNRWIGMAFVVGGVALVSGCSMMASISVSGKQSQPAAQEPESYVRVWMDGKPAKYAEYNCKISGTISTSPTLEYKITDASKMGNVQSVMINIFKEFGDGFSNSADYIVIAAETSNPDAQMKPGVAYNLGDPGDVLRVMDGSGNMLKGITFESGKRYKMNFVVSADRSETVQVVFTAG